MGTTSVNWEALESLIIDFAKSENLIEDLFSSRSPLCSPSLLASSSSSSGHSRLIIRQIRRCLESGDIGSVIDLLRAHAPFVLDDHRLLFRLQKQKFIELLRIGTEEARDSAIQCIRTVLAPCALNAYPEAYEAFKHVLLAFIYDKDDQSSPVANESERRRFDIAGFLSTVLRAHLLARVLGAHLHAYDSLFLMTLHYLISIHKCFCFRQGISSPISGLTERLLLEECDPPATRQESLFEAPPFDEVDIQALAHAVELTRQGAIDSLRFAKGDLFQAFQNELCRMKFNVSMLDELVHEYCVYRGFVDSAPVSPSVPQKQLGTDHCSSTNCSVEVDCATSEHSDVETSIGDTHIEDPLNGTQGTDIELRYASETSNCIDCSMSGSHQPGISELLQRRRNYVTEERNKRKRWMSGQEEKDYTAFVSCNECSKQDLKTTASDMNVPGEEQDLEKHPVLDLKNREDKYDFVLGMKELASKGMAAEVVEEVNALDPNFFVQNPILLFQLKQVEFLKLVTLGDHSSALRVASSHLGTLAARDPSLLKPLKETLLAFLQPNEDALSKGLPLHALATSLQVAIGKKLGIEEPQLMKIMRATLHTHNEWFKLQMCKDRFESLLRIDLLKEVDTLLLSASSTSKSNADSCAQGSSQITISSSARVVEDGSSPTQESPQEVDENAILKVMEFLALPRADPIHLVAQHNGNAETVVQQIFA